MTADVQRELADRLRASHGQLRTVDEIAVRLLPTVQALIADAEKRAAAQALREAADDIAEVPGNPYPLVVSEFLNARAAALDPSGAAEGAGR